MVLEAGAVERAAGRTWGDTWCRARAGNAASHVSFSNAFARSRRDHSQDDGDGV